MAAEVRRVAQEAELAGAKHVLTLFDISERVPVQIRQQLTDNFERVLEIASAILAKAKEDNGQA